jgi:hypothetical protein
MNTKTKMRRPKYMPHVVKFKFIYQIIFPAVGQLEAACSTHKIWASNSNKNYAFTLIFVIKRITNYFIALLIFSVWPFKCQVSAAARTLFTFSVQCRTVFSMSNKNRWTFNGTTLSHSSVKGCRNEQKMLYIVSNFSVNKTKIF